jgi:dTDP-4-dehydrorhamnose reductase
MKKYLITGSNSGLGKYLSENIPNAIGLNRDNFDEVKNSEFDYIINCAFNKELKVSNYKKYLDDNILLNLKLKNIVHKKFIYISSIDIYSDDLNIYSQFKKFSESLMTEHDLVLRCAVLLGKYMKPNHISKIKNNIDSITLSKDSTFNYTSYVDICKFISSSNLKDENGVIDFVSRDCLKLCDVVKFYNSQTKLGQYTYNSDYTFENPIYNLSEEYNKSSLQILRDFDVI